MSEALARLVADPADDGEFGRSLVQLFATLVAFDHVVIFGYRGEEPPIELFSTFNPADHVVFVAKYVRGPYLLDPFYRAAREGRTGLCRMRELAPDRFFSSEYFRSYYVETGLAEEVGFFVPLPDGCAAVLSLMRRGESGIFPARAIELLNDVEPLVGALVRRRWAELGRRFDRSQSAQRNGRRAGIRATPASVWRDLNLTEREAGVIELVLQGHSSDSIARRLEISTGTVKVHRRNVYRKLGIGSQTQLLSIYLDRIAGRGR